MDVRELHTLFCAVDRLYGSDRSVVNSARVSYAKDELTKKELDERDRKLIFI